MHVLTEKRLIADNLNRHNTNLMTIFIDTENYPVQPHLLNFEIYLIGHRSVREILVCVIGLYVSTYYPSSPVGH